MTKPTSQSTQNWLMLCIAIHLVIDFMAVRDVWQPDGTPFLLKAIPLAQCSLVAIWAATSRSHLLVRFFIPPCVTLAIWYLMAIIVTWDLTGGPARSWLIALVIQVILIALACNVYRRWMVRKTNKQAFSFDLRLLFIWMTVLACIFAFFQYGRLTWGWGTARSAWIHGIDVPIIGAINALLACICVWPFAHPPLKPRLARLAAALPMLAVSCGLQRYVLARHGTLDSSIIAITVQLVIGQAFTILISLAMLNQWRSGNTRETDGGSQSNEPLGSS